jgi:hypothetical protein
MIKLKRIFIKDHLSKPLRHLYLHTIIKGLATGLLGFFLPLFLFSIFGKIEWVIVYYLCTHGVTLFSYPLATKVALKMDMKKLMIVATVFLVLYIYVINLFEVGVSLYLVGLAILLINLFRLLYWVPYHTEFAEFSEKHYRGRELSLMNAMIALLGISLPAIAGFIIVKSGFNTLFVIVLVMYVVSVFPLFGIPKKREKFSYGYFETWKILVGEKNRKTFLAYFADGFQSAAGYIIWPIFILLLLKGEYLSVGFISTFIILVSVVLRLIMGDLADHKNKKKLLKIGSWLYSIGWLVKTFVESAFQIFVVGAYHGLSEVLLRTPFDTMMYDRAADREHYIDEYTVLREMSLRIGYLSLLILSLIILSFAGMNWVFVAVALVVLLVNKL